MSTISLFFLVSVAIGGIIWVFVYPFISGEKKAEKEEKDKNYRLVERSYGSFERSLELPRGVNLDAIKASIDKGVLKVTVPKPAPAQVKKVEVKPAA